MRTLTSLHICCWYSSLSAPTAVNRFSPCTPTASLLLLFLSPTPEGGVGCPPRPLSAVVEPTSVSNRLVSRCALPPLDKSLPLAPFPCPPGLGFPCSDRRGGEKARRVEKASMPYSQQPSEVGCVNRMFSSYGWVDGNLGTMQLDINCCI